MKIVFMKAPLGFDARYRTGDLSRLSCFPLAPYHLAGLVQRAGYDAHTIDTVAIDEGFLSAQSISEQFKDVDVAGFSVDSFNLFATREIVTRLKRQFPDLIGLVGGIHPSYFPEKTLRFLGADYALTGEADHSVVDFCRAIEGKGALHQVPNLHWLEDGRHRASPTVGEVHDLNDVAWAPRLDELPPGIYQMAPFESCRGCAYNCSFCSIRGRRNWRGRRCELVLDQLESYVDRVRGKVITNGILFSGECFTADPERARRILAGVAERKLGIRVAINVRLTDLLQHEPLMDQLAEVQPFSIAAGVECGYDEGMARVGKGLRRAQVVQCLQALKERGLSRTAMLSFIIGLPFESFDDIATTLAFAAYCMEQFDCTTSIVWWIPMPSRLWDRLERYNIVPVDDHFCLPPLERYQSLFDYYHSNLSPREVNHVAHLFQLYYSMGMGLMEVHPIPINQPENWTSIASWSTVTHSS